MRKKSQPWLVPLLILIAIATLRFISRAQFFLDRLAEHPAQDIASFSHGQFTTAVAWFIKRKPQEIDGRAMADWREYEIANHVPNCSGYTLSKHTGEVDWELSSEEPLARRVLDKAYQAAHPDRLH